MRDSILRDTYVFAGNPHANYDVMPDGDHFDFSSGSRSGDGSRVELGVGAAIAHGRFALEGFLMPDQKEATR